MLFRDVIGQEELKSGLRERARQGMIPHANLFLGEEGSGPFALAMALAQYMSCPHRTDDDSCGECDSCKKFASFQHPDMHFTYPIYTKGDVSKNVSTSFNEEWRNFIIGKPYPTFTSWIEHLDAAGKNMEVFVGEAEVISRNMALRSYEGGYKFQVIWLAEYLRQETANKLLKTIEEPTKGTIFLLVASSSDRMLSTILSRTQLIKVNAIADEDLTGAIQQRHSLDPQQARDLSQFAEGDYAKVLAMLNNAEGQKELLGQFTSWMRACYKRDASELVNMAAALGGAAKQSQRQFLSYALHFVRQCIVNNYGQTDLARFTSEEGAFASKFAPFIHHGNVLRITELLNEAMSDLFRNANGKMVFMDLSLRLHHELHRPQ
ncbi:MAG: hypothetical protein MK081_05170 [Flavobacteriales bacterium]|nr:hypothetical protein [Flavobacteriales bacterium]